jgi:hypothetical protein
MTEPICKNCKHIYVRAEDCGVFDDIAAAVMWAVYRQSTPTTSMKGIL